MHVPTARTVPQPVKVEFVWADPEAKRVAVCGDFNGWSPEATLLSRQVDGHWHASLALGPGRYQYKYVVDGEWMSDPLAKENVFNQYGTLNSVLEVR